MEQGNLDVSTLQHYLRGTNFPADKEEEPQTPRATVPRRTWSLR
jgi:hypothetical protein